MWVDMTGWYMIGTNVVVIGLIHADILFYQYVSVPGCLGLLEGCLHDVFCIHITFLYAQHDCICSAHHPPPPLKPMCLLGVKPQCILMLFNTRFYLVSFSLIYKWRRAKTIVSASSRCMLI